jgi:hypothetical protein
MSSRVLLLAGAGALLAAAASAHPVAASNFLETANPYAPYEYLIGDWYSPLSGGGSIHQQFKWGPRKAYISYTTYMAEPGKPEHLHFEGIMMWNGKSSALDFLFAVEPPSGVEEKGTVRAGADGTIVREVEMTDGKGAVSHFRQTFRRTGANSAVTMLLRQTDKGWESTIPGVGQIEMTRRD